MSDDDLLHGDSSGETKFRWQNDKETQGGSTQHLPPPWSVGDQLHDFVLEELLGSGSSGLVYRVQDVVTLRRFALKLLYQGQSDDLLRNKLGFRRMMMFEHPNLLKVHRIHQLDSYIGLSMEVIEGPTFEQARFDLLELPREKAYARLLELIRDYAAGLAVMHSHGLVHRDIKPENLMVDTEGRGRIIDYGLVDAYEISRPTIQTRGYLLGTPHYIAPEVIWRQNYLPAGDIFGLGIVLLDTLRLLQSGASGQDPGVKRSRQNLIDDAERIGEAVADLQDSIPSILRETCREMLDRHAAERPTSMALARLGMPPTQPATWLVKPPVVGRDRELKQSLEWVDRVFAGETQRLHLSGDSGVGKSRLVEEIVQYIESKNWGQVFVARCRSREDQPLQAFDQVCDAIAHRYMKGDREPIELDPVSVPILQAVFPVLENILESTLRLQPAGQVNESWNALEAAARFSKQLRQVGPLFLIIDDSQWADSDSRNVLDSLLLTACDVGLGVITVSRDEREMQRVPASLNLKLEPLNETDGVQILSNAAQRWGVAVSDEMLGRLAKLAAGLPFRLQELTEEFRPGGALHHSGVVHPLESGDDFEFPDLSPLQRLWQERAERLSAEAKRVLPMIVTARGQASIEQLGSLTGLGDAVDAAVTELVQQRLVIDEATGGECITIYHDRIARELIRSYSAPALRESHNAWASLLMRQGNAEQLAARIAGHLFDADQPGRAVAHAILAAEDAERRVAKAEAGRWYARVIPHVSGEERVRQVRNAARCFYQADNPTEAAQHYQELSYLVDGEERIECMLLASAASIRCGRTEQVRQQLEELAGLLGLPKPKPYWKSLGSLMLHALRDKLSGQKPLSEVIKWGDTTNSGLSADLVRPSDQVSRVDSIESSEPPSGIKMGSQSGTENSSGPNHSDPNPSIPNSRGLDSEQATRRTDERTEERSEAIRRRNLQAIRLCQSLVRPLSIFDNQYAAELNAAGARLAMRDGDVAQQIHVAVGQAVFGCYDTGPKRIESEASLLMLMSKAERLGSEMAVADLWSGIAFTHALSCRWDHVSQPVESAVEHYERAAEANRFEIAHTRWIDLWAKWHLGRWSEMRQLGDLMLDDAIRRDDTFQQTVAMGGYGVGAWLIQDRVSEVEYRRNQANEVFGASGRPQLYQSIDVIALAQLQLFEGCYEQAWQTRSALVSQLKQMPFSRMQMLRVSCQLLGACIALNSVAAGQNRLWLARVEGCIQCLRSEGIGFAHTMADFVEAMLAFHREKQSRQRVAEKGVMDLLLRVSEECRMRRLRPYYWCVKDAIAEIRTGSPGDRLQTRMRNAGVTTPQKLQRLYGVPDCEPKAS